ncbi:DDE-type integrase/transposase/recombinase [Solemya velum gill symbiont]|uniref:DDE-type integrase/transposase/recombinase n=2 Tax=Solemya velum gill symbiont TaxID=2340 RepID=UPI000997C71E|nr:DDE-type integrase/transposase/recombinase [Solemya velum gill symbiont]OOY54049.1 hypothetical protein BOV99_12340 [Solemya velum gill symbiont]OOY62626.1 hypothetical protein BOW05_13100 [Solemya velum gill symbiont]OOY67331.1 hypothetical protein BOW07_13055 [Solemya velum gill symbiont]OOY72079.1 hypothetical protein BOW09_12275 [Solemya velum gill symbiont]OOY92483.1 hypothetical protein BOW17_12390 [Solemya velum gill symbiont]
MNRYEDYLSEIYHDPKHPASFSGADKLYRAVRKEGRFVLSRKKILNWLGKQETHGVHAEERTKFRRRRVVAPYVDYQWDVDTANLLDYAKENEGYGYFLLAIDVMSKYVWTRPLRHPNYKETINALREIFGEGRKAMRMRTDKGTEFVNKEMEKFLRKENVIHFVTQNVVKANIAERAIKTIKTRLARYATRKQTHRWVDVLSNVTQSYNNTYHRSIKRTPASIKPSDSNRLWQLQYQSRPHRSKFPKKLFGFKVGDLVRVSFLRRPFQRQYHERWSREVFVVNGRFVTEGIPQYRLRDYDDEVIEGTFYQNQLQKAYPQDVYLVERILRRRRRRGNNEYLVRWKGWAPKYDSWVREADMEGVGEDI